MRKVFLSIGFVGLLAISSIYNVNQNKSSNSFSQIVLNNIEALAQVEQPNINDCIPNANFNCASLHPTDHNQDKIKYGYMWP